MSDQAQSQPLTCAVCGSPLEPDDRFCRFCGASVPADAAPSDPDQETRQAPVVDAADAVLWLPPSANPAVEAIDVSEEIIVEPADAAGADVDDLWLPAGAEAAPVETESAVFEETIYAADPPGAVLDEPDAAAAPPPLDVPEPASAMPYSATPYVEQSAGGGNRMWWIIGGIVLFFVLVCCCLAFGIAAVTYSDTGFQDELRGTAGLLLAIT